MNKQMTVLCFVSLLAGSGAGMGISSTIRNVYQNREFSALEERVEKLEKEVKILDDSDTEQWGEIRENSIYGDELKDEIEELKQEINALKLIQIISLKKTKEESKKIS